MKKRGDINLQIKALGDAHAISPKDTFQNGASLKLLAGEKVTLTSKANKSMMLYPS